MEVGERVVNDVIVHFASECRMLPPEPEVGILALKGHRHSRGGRSEGCCQNRLDGLALGEVEGQASVDEH